MTSTAGKLDKNRYIYLSLNMISYIVMDIPELNQSPSFYLIRLCTTTQKPKSKSSGYVNEWKIFKLNNNLNFKLNLNHFG